MRLLNIRRSFCTILFFLGILCLTLSCGQSSVSHTQDDTEVNTSPSAEFSCSLYTGSVPSFVHCINLSTAYNDDDPILSSQWDLFTDDGSLILTTGLVSGTPDFDFEVIEDGVFTLHLTIEDSSGDSDTYAVDSFSFFNTSLGYSIVPENTGIHYFIVIDSNALDLDIGDQIGVFDAQGVLISNECGDEFGELLVGFSTWSEDQLSSEPSALSVTAIGSVDFCSIDGPLLPGYVPGNPIIIKVFKVSESKEYSTTFTTTMGGSFSGPMTVITSIELID